MQACYNIGAGIETFERLKRVAKSSDTKSWLQHWSSHPSMLDRMQHMQKDLPKVLDDSPCSYREDLLRSMAKLAQSAM